MSEISYDVRKWKDLGFADKMKYSIASLLVLSSIIIGFGSFIWLAMIPTSVIALSGLWLSTALAILGISSYFHNEMVQFQGKINDKLKKMEKDEQVEREDRKHRYEGSSDDIAYDEHNA